MTAAASFLLTVLITFGIHQCQSMEWELQSSYDTTEFATLGRHHPIVFANETHAFLLGGTTRSSTADNAFFIYDEAADQWTDHSEAALAFPPRTYAYGVVLNQANHPKAYLGFGAGLNEERLNDWWELDMTTLEFRPLASCPGPGRRHPSMVPVYLPDRNQWQIHVGLGDGVINEEFSNWNDYWSYDIETDEWTQLPDFPSSKRHHPFFFGLGAVSYTGLGHSDGYDPYIERDFYSFDTITGEWTREPDFESYAFENGTLQTTEARVAGTEFSIELPLVGADPSEGGLVGALGFVLSGDGDDHGPMDEGEFHAFYPADSQLLEDSSKRWRQLPPHPGASRWAPGSFVMRGTARAYFTSGYDQSTGELHSDVWRIDLSSLLALKETPTTVLSAQEELGVGSDPNATTDAVKEEEEEEEQETPAGEDTVNTHFSEANELFQSSDSSRTYSSVWGYVIFSGTVLFALH